jgi:heme-degrading monooxygenase HmoA
MYAIAWDFLPASGRADDFLRAYAADGTWVALFRRGSGYLGTELLALADRPGWYRTVDRWESEEAYAAFRAAYAVEYAALDLECEALTVQELCEGKE